MSNPNGESDPNQAESASPPTAASDELFNVSNDVAAALKSGVPPDVASGIEEWRPEKLTAHQRRALPIVLPFVRWCVTTAQPASLRMARQLLRPTTLLAIWAYSVLGSLVTEVVFSAHNVEHFSTVVSRHRSKGWQHQTRWALRRVGRAVNPDGWPLELPTVGRHNTPLPYVAREEARFRFMVMASELPSRVARRVLAATTLGGGLRGTEVADLTPDDVMALDGGRFAVTVRGPNPRLVPIRADYLALLHEAIKESDGSRFFRGTSRNVVSELAVRLLGCPVATNRRNGLSLRRARSTWLAAHLAANTPLPALRSIAGPLSWMTMDSLIEHLNVEIDPQEAVEQGLRA